MTRFATSGRKLNREGIAITDKFVIVTDQIDPRSKYNIFSRSSKPLPNLKEIALWRGMAQSTDGIDAIAKPMGGRFPADSSS